jgi:hypothetical protein
MNAEKVAYYLLTNDSGLDGVVPNTRIYAGLIPLSSVLPAIAYNLVSTVEETAIGLTASKNRSRVQVTVAAKTYPQVKSIVELVKTACNHQQGTFNGVSTDSVILDNVGADFRDDEAAIFYSTIDFRIAHN